MITYFIKWAYVHYQIGDKHRLSKMFDTKAEAERDRRDCKKNGNSPTHVQRVSVEIEI